MTRDGWEVCSKTFAVCAVAYLITRLVAIRLPSTIHDPGVRWTVAFAAVQAVTVVLLSFHLLAVRTYAQRKHTIEDQIRPAIRERILNLAFEGESWSSGVPASGPARRVMEQSIAHALTTLKASGRDRVARFALEQGFVAEWVSGFSSASRADRKRMISLVGLVAPGAGGTVLPLALHDKQTSVRIEAYRALSSGDRGGIDTVFRSVVRESLLVRALLVDDLKRHAPYLSANTIPLFLENASELEAARCFEMLIAWKRALPSFDIHPWLLGPPDPLLWPLVLALLPYVPIDASVQQYLISALNSTDVEVQCMAASAAGALKLGSLIPLLSTAVSGKKRLAAAAATALSQIGEAGERCLENIVTGSDRRAALVAMEALERVTVQAR